MVLVAVGDGLFKRGSLVGTDVPRLEESGEIASLAQLRDAQLDGVRARLPQVIAIAVAVVDPLGTALAMPGAGQALDLELSSGAARRSRPSRAADRHPNSSP